MSDNLKDLEKHFERNVLCVRHNRRVGLCTIPEYPEYESRHGMWSVALDAILTTLRYLAPATLLTLFWGHHSFLFKLLKHIDSAFRAIVFSSEEQKQEVLRWLAEVGPVRVDDLETVWKHGWIVCGVLDAALPGSCAGHPPTRLSLQHAQSIADHYLGVEPVFSRQELESNDSLSRHQEWKLATYLDRIREALKKLTPPVSKPTSQRTSPETTQITLDYVAKGSGLTAAQIKNKMHFKIYPTAQQSLDPGEITVLIRGPKDTYGMTVLPPILGKAQMIRQKLLGLHSKQNFTENALPLTLGAAYLRSYGKNDMNKTYYIPKTKYDIEIEADTRGDHIKISYTVNLEGRYEISITSRGQSIVGSPFVIKATHNIISILEKDSFHLEDGEEIDIVDVKNDRKVVLRIVDFVTEKMLLRENGTLEKISDEEAKLLMTTDSENKNPLDLSKTNSLSTIENKVTGENESKFNQVARKILWLNRVCRRMNKLIDEKQSILKDTTYIPTRSSKDIPDIVNSTFGDKNTNPFIIAKKQDKYIVPENISVSIRTEKSKPIYDEIHEIDTPNTDLQIGTAGNKSESVSQSHSVSNSPDSLNESEKFQNIEDSSLDRLTYLINNPFVAHKCEENLLQDNDFGTIVISQYETNDSQNEDIQNNSIKIAINTSCNSSLSPNSNPFIDDDLKDMERPKTPIHKIISGEVTDRNDSVYENPKSELIPEEMLGNEFVNPFFMHHHKESPHLQLPITDFIIGAPVSLPPMMRTSSPEPEMKSLIIIPSSEQNMFDNNVENKQEVINTQYYTNKDDCSTDRNKTITETYNSFESNFTQSTETSAVSNESEKNCSSYKIDGTRSERDTSPRKDWDSAYVSIDDNSSCPDTNNNDNVTLYEALNKEKISPTSENFLSKQREMANMGPAERELWQTCSELGGSQLSEVKSNRWEIQRPTFTPIIEENDRSVSSGAKALSDSQNANEAESIAVAFAELNDMYMEYFPKAESSSTVEIEERIQFNEKTDKVEPQESSVNSASVPVSDVKRHENKVEGTISEVQSNATESVSVSQSLLDEIQVSPESSDNNNIQMSNQKKNNIVLERKKYWDEKIRQIEANSQETVAMQRKKRVSTKQMKHDSLSKRKGRQMVKNYLRAGGYSHIKNTTSNDNAGTVIDTSIPQSVSDVAQEEQCQTKLVDKWKKYWDEKLQKEIAESDSVHIKLKAVDATCSNPQLPVPEEHLNTNINENRLKNENIAKTEMAEKVFACTPTTPVKQELPEEVFKAFETSPKRFFGTSRRQILSKIDIFCGKHSSSDESSPEIIEANHESGLVSSRISLFHNLSNTEELPWARKTKSMHNIHQRKDNDSVVVSPDIRPKTLDESRICSMKNVLVQKENTNIDEDKFENAIQNEEIKCSRVILKAAELNKELQKRSRSVVQEYITTNVTPDHNKDIASETPINCVNEILRRKSFSKSEMDIFSKISKDSSDDYLDKYKSCDELPKINVKNFISLYETVSKSNIESKPFKRIYKANSVDSEKLLRMNSTNSDAVKTTDVAVKRTERQNIRFTSRQNSPECSPRKLKTRALSAVNIDNIDKELIDIKVIKGQDKETTYVSLSDIELEIVESSPDKSTESTPKKETVAEHVEYKNRFRLAKQYFQSLEELTDEKRPTKPNECEILLNKPIESLDTDKPKRRKKKSKSLSMPSSELSKYWSEMQGNHTNNRSDTTTKKLVKISEKFNVEDLFLDVMEGKLSRQGSLRGIPHKKAVLATFRSMENLSNNQLNSYDISETQYQDFENQNTVKKAQNYLTEYPYIPTTDPSKYHSRLDAKASGLISFKELLGKKKRRNSVPDLRLDPTFSADL
ncbi:uncharacterized protein LOC105843010 isoform X1 [Bombyx mori]|uniref:Uncharacterized protein n=1 Tax=Bombyx mori TaxID=7091 RepID=A0A8R2GDX8_BOMMO|nr:uncharacterized protein LOC105843010 isoform X1 [Bombyx mori]XP_012553304.2 uncharacterized protein LOC105843010 isoform X1 [Bombyx mori]